MEEVEARNNCDYETTNVKMEIIDKRDKKRGFNPLMKWNHLLNSDQGQVDKTISFQQFIQKME